MGVYAAGWIFAVVVTALRIGEVPAQLWAVLGVGEGALMAIFRGDEALRRGHDQAEKKDQQP